MIVWIIFVLLKLTTSCVRDLTSILYIIIFERKPVIVVWLEGFSFFFRVTYTKVYNLHIRWILASINRNDTATRAWKNDCQYIECLHVHVIQQSGHIVWKLNAFCFLNVFEKCIIYQFRNGRDHTSIEFYVINVMYFLLPFLIFQSKQTYIKSPGKTENQYSLSESKNICINDKFVLLVQYF